MAVKIKAKFVKAPIIYARAYWPKLTKRIASILKKDDFQTNRQYHGYIDGLIKAGGLSTSEMQETRELRQIAALVTKSLDSGNMDPTLKEILDENQCTESK